MIEAAFTDTFGGCSQPKFLEFLCSHFLRIMPSSYYFF
jgi:hypothetical protein